MRNSRICQHKHGNHNLKVNYTLVFQNIGSNSSTDEYVTSKVQVGVKEISRWSQIDCTHPHEAYSPFTHGISNKWS